MKLNNDKQLIFFVLLLTVLVIKCENLNFKHDKERDIIFYNGKLYFPSSSFSNIRRNLETKTLAEKTNTKSEHSSHHEGEEELATGGSFWMYIFTILSIFE